MFLGWHECLTTTPIGSASSADKIWAVLTPEERARFTRAVKDPGSELAKTLLTSPDLAEDIPAPWWVTPPSTPQANAPVSRPERPPDIMAIPEAFLTDSTSLSHAPPAFPLAYNLVAILWVPSSALCELSTYFFTRQKCRICIRFTTSFCLPTLFIVSRGAIPRFSSRAFSCFTRRQDTLPWHRVCNYRLIFTL